MPKVQNGPALQSCLVLMMATTNMVNYCEDENHKIIKVTLRVIQMIAITNMVKKTCENKNDKMINFKLRVVQMMATTNMDNEDYNTAFTSKAEMDTTLQSWQWYC